ncbi:MAG TPA: thioredoxin [Gemmatimonadaceae bacterium]|nr:thioredoxin [Gemmatimonadaceae bacterium]
MAQLPEIADATFEAEVERAPGLTIVDFWAPWCPPCHAIAPVLERIAASRNDVRILSINNDENVRSAARHGVRSLPTLVFFKDGKAVDRIIGAVPRTRIEAAIDKHCPPPD